MGVVRPEKLITPLDILDMFLFIVYTLNSWRGALCYEGGVEQSAPKIKPPVISVAGGFNFIPRIPY